MKKYYKALFLGLVDMALVNAFIVYKCYFQKMKERPPSHADFLLQLQGELLALRDEVFAAKPMPRAAATGTSAAYVPQVQRMAHSILQTTDRVADGSKRRTRVCKVCSVLSDGRFRKHETTFYCVECSDQKRSKCMIVAGIFWITSDSHLFCRPSLLVQLGPPHGHRELAHMLSDLAQSVGVWVQVPEDNDVAHPDAGHRQRTCACDADAPR